MSKRDVHYLIKEQAELDGWNKSADINTEAFTVYQQYKMVLNRPEARVKALRDIDAAIGADDGSSLRSKADLFELRRQLKKSHEALLKAGR
jgi:hypothetical protein